MNLSHSLPCAVLAAFLAVGSAAAKDPVRITLEGTTLSRLPIGVSVVTDTPIKDLEAFLKEASPEAKSAPGPEQHAALKNGVRYDFVRAGKVPKHAGQRKFQPGDVIYTIVVGSIEEAELLAKKHSLKQIESTISETGRFSALHEAEKGYYVVLAKPGTVHTCVMHPKVRNKKDGKCPICEMSLIPLKD